MRSLWLGLILLLAACTGGRETAVLPTAALPTAVATAESQPTLAKTPSSLPPVTRETIELAAAPTPEPNRRIDQEPIYVTPLIPFDGIAPIYDPQFEAATDAPLQDDELVMGVAWDGEAKAYPITVLRFREMVDDELAGIPTLVTW